MSVEYKAGNVKLFPSTKEDEEKGLLHAVVSVFGNTDSDGDVIVKGAFKSSIEKSQKRGKFPSGVWHHNWDQPVAKTLEMWEGDDGLHIRAKFNLNTQIGRETYYNIKEEIIDEYSFGFRTVQADRKADGRRYISDLEMKEWSPVLWGANPATQTIAIKQDEKTFEKWKEIQESKELEQKSIFAGAEQQLLMRTVSTLADRFWRLGYDLAYGSGDKEAKLDALNNALAEFNQLMGKYCNFHLDCITASELDDSEDYMMLGANEFTEVKEGKTVIYTKKLEKIANDLYQDSKLDDDIKSEFERIYSVVRIKSNNSKFLPPWLQQSEVKSLNLEIEQICQLAAMEAKLLGVNI